MKKNLLFVLSVLVVASMALTGCGAPAEEVAEAEFTCALITPNPLGDRSFIDASARGIKRANEALPVKCDIIETNGVAEHETALRGAISKGYDLVLGLAMDTEMFVNLAAEFPDQKFASPSEIFLDTLPENMVAYQIDVHESSFLAVVCLISALHFHGLTTEIPRNVSIALPRGTARPRLAWPPICGSTISREPCSTPELKSTPTTVWEFGFMGLPRLWRTVSSFETGSAWMSRSRPYVLV